MILFAKVIKWHRTMIEGTVQSKISTETPANKDFEVKNQFRVVNMRSDEKIINTDFLFFLGILS